MLDRSAIFHGKVLEVNVENIFSRPEVNSMEYHFPPGTDGERYTQHHAPQTSRIISQFEQREILSVSRSPSVGKTSDGPIVSQSSKKLGFNDEAETEAEIDFLDVSCDTMVDSHETSSCTSESYYKTNICTDTFEHSKFQISLIRMIREWPSVVHWDEVGLHFIDPGALQKYVLPQYFRTCRYESFLRQLHMYNFRKVAGRGRWNPASYCHPDLKGNGDPKCILELRPKARVGKPFATSADVAMTRNVALSSHKIHTAIRYPSHQAPGMNLGWSSRQPHQAIFFPGCAHYNVPTPMPMEYTHARFLDSSFTQQMHSVLQPYGMMPPVAIPPSIHAQIQPNLRSYGNQFVQYPQTGVQMSVPMVYSLPVHLPPQVSIMPPSMQVHSNMQGYIHPQIGIPEFYENANYRNSGQQGIPIFGYHNHSPYFQHRPTHFSHPTEFHNNQQRPAEVSLPILTRIDDESVRSSTASTHAIGQKSTYQEFSEDCEFDPPSSTDLSPERFMSKFKPYVTPAYFLSEHIEGGQVDCPAGQVDCPGGQCEKNLPIFTASTEYEHKPREKSLEDISTEDLAWRKNGKGGKRGSPELNAPCSTAPNKVRKGPGDSPDEDKTPK